MSREMNHGPTAPPQQAEKHSVKVKEAGDGRRR
jgi:hypothetical protein